MSTVLKNVIQFTGLVIGVPVTLPHSLNVNGLAVIPDLVLPATGGYTTTASTTSITITRGIGANANVNVYTEHWHSIEDCEPPGGLGSLLPFIVDSSTGNSGAASPIVSLTNSNAGSLTIGMAVYGPSSGHCDKAVASALATASVIGLVFDAAIATNTLGQILTNGPLTATTAQWDAVSDSVGGLVFNTRYYLDPTTLGKLTSTAPTVAGQVLAPIGLAVSTTILVINIWPTELLA